MLAKVIAWGPDRAAALRGLRTALARTTVLGVDTNTAFLRALLAHPEVASGELDTGLVDRAAAGLLPDGVPDEVYGAAALLRQAALTPGTGAAQLSTGTPDAAPEAGPVPGGGAIGWVSPFSVPSGWRLGGQRAWTVHQLRVPGRDPVAVRVRPAAPDGRRPEGRPAPGEMEVSVDGATPVRARLAAGAAAGGPTVRLDWDGMSHAFTRALCMDGDTPEVWLGREGEAWQVRGHDPVADALRRAGSAHGVDALTAPMPGTVTVVKVAVGDEVTAGQSLLVVEAMKMEHVITAPHAGRVAGVKVTAGSTVAMDQVLAVVDPYEDGEAAAGTEAAE